MHAHAVFQSSPGCVQRLNTMSSARPAMTFLRLAPANADAVEKHCRDSGTKLMFGMGRMPRTCRGRRPWRGEESALAMLTRRKSRLLCWRQRAPDSGLRAT